MSILIGGALLCGLLDGCTASPTGPPAALHVVATTTVFADLVSQVEAIGSLSARSCRLAANRTP